MSNVVNLGGGQASAARAPVIEVIETLEEMLADAREGRIQDLIAIVCDGEGACTDLYAGSGEVRPMIQLVGTMELCKHTILGKLA